MKRLLAGIFTCFLAAACTTNPPLQPNRPHPAIIVQGVAINDDGRILKTADYESIIREAKKQKDIGDRIISLSVIDSSKVQVLTRIAREYGEIVLFIKKDGRWKRSNEPKGDWTAGIGIERENLTKLPGEGHGSAG